MKPACVHGVACGCLMLFANFFGKCLRKRGSALNPPSRSHTCHSEPVARHSVPSCRNRSRKVSHAWPEGCATPIDGEDGPMFDLFGWTLWKTNGPFLGLHLYLLWDLSCLPTSGSRASGVQPHLVFLCLVALKKHMIYLKTSKYIFVKSTRWSGHVSKGGKFAQMEKCTNFSKTLFSKNKEKFGRERWEL